MKIVAKTGSGSFLVDATEHELARIMGFAYTNSIPADKKLDLGREVDVSRMYEALAVERAKIRAGSDRSERPYTDGSGACACPAGGRQGSTSGAKV